MARFAKTAAKAVTCLENRLRGCNGQSWLPEKCTDIQERFNDDTRRGERVIRIFPDYDSVLRLIGALLTEHKETWQERKYLDRSGAEASTATTEVDNVVDTSLRGLLLLIDPRPSLCTRGLISCVFIIHRLGKAFIRNCAIAAENAETAVPEAGCVVTLRPAVIRYPLYSSFMPSSTCTASIACLNCVCSILPIFIPSLYPTSATLHRYSWLCLYQCIADDHTKSRLQHLRPPAINLSCQYELTSPVRRDSRYPDAAPEHRPVRAIKLWRPTSRKNSCCEAKTLLTRKNNHIKITITSQIIHNLDIG